MFKVMFECCRSKINPALIAVIVAGLSASAARADVISGPTLNVKDSNWNVSGLGFTATVDAALTSFTFQNQGLADTVDLVDLLGNILDSVATPSGTPSDTVSVDWSLTGGHSYYLLQTTRSNSLFTPWGVAAPSDGEIAVTDTGDFSNVLNSSGFGIGGGAGAGTNDWAAFNNITASAGTAVPEPASFGLVLLAAVAIWWRARVAEAPRRRLLLGLRLRYHLAGTVR